GRDVRRAFLEAGGGEGSCRGEDRQEGRVREIGQEGGRLETARGGLARRKPEGGGPQGRQRQGRGAQDRRPQGGQPEGRQPQGRESQGRESQGREPQGREPEGGRPEGRARE